MIRDVFIDCVISSYLGMVSTQFTADLEQLFRPGMVVFSLVVFWLKNSQGLDPI